MQAVPGLPELLRRFRKEENLPPPRRKATAARIASSRDPKALDFLLSQVPRERSGLVQSILVKGIGRRLGEARVVRALPSLWTALLPSSRLALARSLPRRLPGELLPFFRDIFKKTGGKDPFLQAALVGPLARSLSKGEVLPFLRSAAEREFRLRVRPHPAMARALGEALARLGGREAQKLFVALAATRPWGLESFFLRKASSFQDPESLDWWIQGGLSSKSNYIRLLSLFGLAGSRSPKVLEALRKALSDRDPRIQREAARALGASGDARGARFLERMLRKGPLVNRLEALDALHRLRRKDPAWRKTLVKLLASPYPAFRAHALDLLAGLGARDIFDKAVKGAVDRNWMVRSAFYAFAAKVRDPRAVPLLIDRLGVETGRLKQEVEKALHEIAGLTFGYDIKQWRYWWGREKDKFTPPPRRKPVARKRRYGITYYGIPVVSRRVVFVLDVSGSMAARTGTGGRTRLDLAKEALVQALTRFTRETRFNIIFFHTRVKAWEKKLMPATRANQKKAVRFVRSTRPMGATNLYGALESAFRNRDADTIYLLSDGSPTAGKVLDPGAIIRDVLSWNRARRIVIHTISLGTPSPLLERLARETGGQYVRR